MVVRGVCRIQNIFLTCGIRYLMLIHFQEVHMVATDLSITHPRSLVVDFTIPFSEEPMSLVIPYPQLESTIARIIKPFKPEVSYLRYSH